MESDFDDTIFNDDIEHLVNTESPEISDCDGIIQINPNLGLETDDNMEYADSRIDEINHSHEIKDRNELSKDLAGPETYLATETIEDDLHQEQDELEMVGITKNILEVNHDLEQWNKIKVRDSVETLCKISISRHIIESIDS